MARPGTLYLIPVYLGDPDLSQLPAVALEKARSIKHFVVENEKSARAFLKSIGTPVPQNDLEFLVLDEHTKDEEFDALLKPLIAGNDVGLMSEAGCPGIADPGSPLVRLAHLKHIRAVPLVGPSSILLGLMASGLNGQRFRFHGYLSREKAERRDQLKVLSKETIKTGETQIFIETPYRNDSIIEDILTFVEPAVTLCIASDLSTKQESIRSLPISDWKKMKNEIGKKPCVFLLGAPAISSRPEKAHRPSRPRHRR